ncbi:MAG: hypothetical protein LUQ71_10215 [Methanoregula sp.]|nr:hypothetical protein [Methanoregula sp.]
MDYGTTLKMSGADLAFENYGLAMISGVEKVQQDLQVLLTSLKRSYSLNTSFGIDYPHLIELQSLTAIQSAISAALESYEYTDEVVSVKATRNTDRSVSIAAQIVLTGGETVSVEASV